MAKMKTRTYWVVSLEAPGRKWFAGATRWIAASSKEDRLKFATREEAERFGAGLYDEGVFVEEVSEPS